ncbi:O-antigen ligase family protein [Clostridium baratii]|uniref:O-antigen ligase family protein n=1 Tax=Clostridium baratii TaxID=1561 RepID=UPI0030CABE96
MKNKNLKKSKKYILIFISLIDIYFSSSKTILIISFIILLNNYMKNNLNEKKQKFLKYSLITLAIPIICLLVPKVISKLSESRDVNSLGGRVYIWEAGIHKSVNDFWGIGRFDSLNWITTDKLPGGLYTHAHNMYINEMIERGIIPGIIFTLIFVYMIFMFKNSLNRYILIGCFLSSMMDNILTSEISYIFWLMMFINYEYEKYYYNKNKVEIYEKGLSNRPKP